VASVGILNCTDAALFIEKILPSSPDANVYAAVLAVYVEAIFGDVITAPVGIVTVPVNVGEASGALVASLGTAVALVKLIAEGVPRLGVTKVGLVAKTNEPEPVSSDMTPASSVDVVAARADSLSVVTTKVLVDGIVVPLIDVAVATPSAGVISVGLVSTTNLVPVPVWDAIEVTAPTDVIGPVRLLGATVTVST